MENLLRADAQSAAISKSKGGKINKNFCKLPAMKM